jgi:hypothetical protein
LRIPHEPMARSSPTRSGGADSISSPASSSSEEEEPPVPAMATAAAEEQVMREERTMVSHLRRPRRVSVTPCSSALSVAGAWHKDGTAGAK